MREKLSGYDLRSIAKVDQVIASITTQTAFDELFYYLYDDDRLVRMRSIDALEKITRSRATFLQPHKSELFAFCDEEQLQTKEFKWHLALLLTRLSLNKSEQLHTFRILKTWVLDANESKIVRTNALQSLYELTQQNSTFKADFQVIVQAVKKAQIPSLNARLRNLGC